jgi:hypothetical protein
MRPAAQRGKNFPKTVVSAERVWAAAVYAHRENGGEDTKKIPVEPNLMHWQLRARFNSHRHYEIYLIEVDEGITVEDIRKAFEDSPQTMADTVRRIGHRFYSNRATEQVRIV